MTGTFDLAGGAHLMSSNDEYTITSFITDDRARCGTRRRPARAASAEKSCATSILRHQRIASGSEQTPCNSTHAREFCLLLPRVL